MVDTVRTVSDEIDFEFYGSGDPQNSSLVLHSDTFRDGLYRTDREGNRMTWYLVKPQVSGGMNLFSATSRLEDLFAAYEAIFILAEADPTFAKAQEDMTIYYD